MKIRREMNLILGTALWGWGVDRIEAFRILDGFLSNGGETIDTASNYPINKRREDYGLAIRWISEWISLNPGADISILAKIGAVDNMGSNAVDLSLKNINSTVDSLFDSFGSFLSCVSIHWDNRGESPEDFPKIIETVCAMGGLIDSGLNVGLSGIKYPELYYKSNPGLADSWVIQVKENMATNSSRMSYMDFFPNSRYLAYGINMGGVKLVNTDENGSLILRNITVDESKLELLSMFLNSDHGFSPRPHTLNDLALAFSYHNQSLSGLIIGPRDLSQLADSFDYWNKLQSISSNDFCGLDLLARQIRS